MQLLRQSVYVKVRQYNLVTAYIIQIKMVLLLEPNVLVRVLPVESVLPNTIDPDDRLREGACAGTRHVRGGGARDDATRAT